AAGPRNPANKAPNGKPAVKADFATVKYGASALVEAPRNEVPEQPKPKGPKTGPAEPAGPTVNAVRIKGFWRENTLSQNVVSVLLKKLRENSSTFRFKFKGPNGADINLGDEQILDITVTGKPGELGLPFEITLPLAREVAIK
ncbi:MAG TPA: hypothetical protein VLL73_07620, partial [Desulfurivibrionaceae bacterium]|nr:hypothetical protein [Desulfurivibrionaceae bacterium]